MLINLSLSKLSARRRKGWRWGAGGLTFTFTCALVKLRPIQGQGTRTHARPHDPRHAHALSCSPTLSCGLAAAQV